jgi:PAS domain-containing protein
LPFTGNQADPITIERPIGAESRREALGRFLRERREALAPEQAGLASDRKRRTPGLRREEVAFLADIGVKWYARLEACDDIHPSAAALAGIAFALRLSPAEHEYLLCLAGLRQPAVDAARLVAMPKPLEALLARVPDLAVTMGDRILTPLDWNATADALYGYSQFEDPIERNCLVRALFDPGFRSFLGTEKESLIASAVGMFRLDYSSPSPSPYAAAIYERIKEHRLFQKFWGRHVVASALPQEESMVRNHDRVGRLEMNAIDLNSAMCSEWLIRIVIPANDATAAKFRRLHEFGVARVSLDGEASALGRREAR